MPNIGLYKRGPGPKYITAVMHVSADQCMLEIFLFRSQLILHRTELEIKQEKR